MVYFASGGRRRLASSFCRGGVIRATPKQRVNQEIRAPQVRLIDIDGKQIGIVDLRDALNAARERGLDLVEVAPDSQPPVCKLLDYGKYLYEQTRRERDMRRAQREKASELKEIRLRPKTDDYHVGFKVERARKFLKQGFKVRVRILFRGREITHPEIGQELLSRVAEGLEDLAEVEHLPDLEGRTMVMVMAPR
jgi:translation initiation factor IF-3